MSPLDLGVLSYFLHVVRDELLVLVICYNPVEGDGAVQLAVDHGFR